MHIIFVFQKEFSHTDRRDNTGRGYTGSTSSMRRNILSRTFYVSETKCEPLEFVKARVNGQKSKVGDLHSNAMKNVSKVVVQGMVNNLGDLKRYCVVGPMRPPVEGRELRIICHDQDGDQWMIDVGVRSLGTGLAKANLTRQAQTRFR